MRKWKFENKDGFSDTVFFARRNIDAEIETDSNDPEDSVM